MSRTIRTDRAREAFLAMLAETCNVSEACRAAEIGRRSAYDWREADPSFAAAWDEAEEVAADKLEKVAWDRATTGLSDRMLEILLKAHRPKYRDSQRLEHTGKDGGPIETADVTQDAERVAGLIGELARRTSDGPTLQ
jgi:hypothetical protein